MELISIVQDEKDLTMITMTVIATMTTTIIMKFYQNNKYIVYVFNKSAISLMHLP